MLTVTDLVVGWVVIVASVRCSDSSCEKPDHFVRYTFAEVLSEAVLEGNVSLNVVFELLTQFRPRSATLNCVHPFVPYVWPSAQIPYIIHEGYSDDARERIESDLAMVNNRTCLEMIPHTTEPHLIKFVAPAQPCFRTMKSLHFMYKDTHRVGYQPDRLMPNAMHYVVASEPHVLRDGIAGDVMAVLGFTRQETRHDRDEHMSLDFSPKLKLYDVVFRKDAPTALSNLFAYDPSSATHITAATAALYNVGLNPRGPKNIPADGSLSKMDVEKISRLICQRSIDFSMYLNQSIDDSISRDSSGSDNQLDEGTATLDPSTSSPSASPPVELHIDALNNGMSFKTSLPSHTLMMLTALLTFFRACA